MQPHYLNTGQTLCYDMAGRELSCRGSGQDAEFRTGAPWPEPRFEIRKGTVLDLLTGLVWLRDANHAGFPVTWDGALEHAAALSETGHAGRADWRLPNRRELRSLISHQDRKPALPKGHPFRNVFLGWYWTSTSYAGNRAYAWYVHTEGGRMFFGHKQQSFLVWPVAGNGNALLPATGQRQCHDSPGLTLDCAKSGQDGERQRGVSWPEPRFEMKGHVVRDELTGLVWSKNADLAHGPVGWREALMLAADPKVPEPKGYGSWRLPTINELESLVDADRHSPALPGDHPFEKVADAYWSSTSSAFEPDWCMALYMQKGAVGVGQKQGEHFHVWAVCSPT